MLKLKKMDGIPKNRIEGITPIGLIPLAGSLFNTFCKEF
jgi:hypothetical protein